jgi:hypothetical protein
MMWIMMLRGKAYYHRRGFNSIGGRGESSGGGIETKIKKRQRKIHPT